MATLIVNAENLPRLSLKIVQRLQRGTLGYEALCGWTGSTHQSVAKELHRLKTKGLVEHDGRRPRTWAIAGTLPKPPEPPPTPIPVARPVRAAQPLKLVSKRSLDQQRFIELTETSNGAPAPQRLLSWAHLRPCIGGLGRSTVWRMCAAGTFPKPVQVSPGRVAWRESDVRAWQQGLLKEPEAA